MRKTYPLIYLFLTIVFLIFLNSIFNAINVKKSIEKITREQFTSLRDALKISLEGAYAGEYLFLEQVRERMRAEALLIERLKDRKNLAQYFQDVAGIWIIDTLKRVEFKFGKKELPEWINERLKFPPGVKEVFLHPTGERHLFAYLKKLDGRTLIILREEKRIEIFGDVFRFEKLLDILTSTGRLIYLALIDEGGKIVTWSSRPGLRVPLPESAGGTEDIKVIETDAGRILEMRVPFKGKGGRTLTLIAGYSYEPIEEIVNSFMKNSILIGLLFVALAILSFIVTHQVRKKMEEKEREIEEIKKREEFFRDLSALASGIAHEIKNPLNSIKMSLQMLNETREENREKYMKLINEELERVNEIVTNFLNLGKPLKPVRRKFNLSLIVKELLTFMEVEAQEKGNKLVFKGPEEFFVCADSDLIRTVLINVIKNAIEATQNGIIEIELKDMRERKLIVVKDTGKGIKPEELAEIFKPYYTKKEGGVGLGMSIAKKIIDAHGGEIKIKSQVGRGTEVIIILKDEADSTCN